MISFFLTRRLARLGRRPVEDPSIKATIRACLVQAGCLPARVSWGTHLRLALASMGIFTVGLGGMASYAYASDAVLPDTPFYPLRKTLETIETSLAPTPEVRAKVIEKHLQKRKKEAHLLEALHKPLPLLHTKLLREEQEESRSAHRSSSSTRLRLTAPLKETLPRNGARFLEETRVQEILRESLEGNEGGTSSRALPEQKKRHLQEQGERRGSGEEQAVKIPPFIGTPSSTRGDLPGIFKKLHRSERRLWEHRDQRQKERER